MKLFTGIIFFFLLLLIQGCSKTADEYFKAGAGNIKLKNYTEALEDFNNAIEMNPKFAKAFLERGKLKLFLKDNTGAESDFDKAIKYEPSFTEEALLNKSKIRLGLNDYAASINYLTVAEEINPGSKQIYYQRADAKKKLNDIPGVISDYTNLIALDSLNAEAFLLRGEQYLLNKDKSSACKDFKIAKKLSSNPGLTEKIDSCIKSNCR